jgi:hypothetical protein
MGCIPPNKGFSLEGLRQLCTDNDIPLDEVMTGFAWQEVDQELLVWMLITFVWKGDRWRFTRCFAAR